MSKRTISMSEVKHLLNYTIDNNLMLQEKGIKPIAVCLTAQAGIGKTAIIQQVAEERGAQYTQINLHQLEETGDLLGMPIVENEYQIKQVVKDADGKLKWKVMPNTSWINAKQTPEDSNYMKYLPTGKSRTSYARPDWVPNYCEKGNVVVFDDMTRATPQLLQAIMEVIKEQKFTSWTLPKKTTIFITSNPDDGNYNVNSQDEAQNGRYLDYNVEFSESAWAQWAEQAEIDGRCINFVLSNSSNLFGSDEEGNHICNPRSFVMFANMISGIKDWDSTDGQEMISLISKGCFKDEEGRFSKMFSIFIRNKMHLIIQPKEVLTGKWEDVKKKLEESLYDSNGDVYRADIASIVEKRFVSYVGNCMKSEDAKVPIAVVIDRIHDFLKYEDTNHKPLFSPDLMFHMVKSITSDNKGKTNKILFDPVIMQRVLVQ